MKICFYFFCALLTLSGYSQDTIPAFYIPLKEYVKQGIPLTKQDSLNFHYNGEDTLVMVSRKFIEERNKNVVRVEYEPKDSLFLDIYKNVVYGKPTSENRNQQTMKYWKDEIKIYFDSSVPVEHSQHLMEFANEISLEIDSLKITKVATREESNYLVYYLNREHNIDYEPRISNHAGGYYINWNGNQQIYNASLKINTEATRSKDFQSHLLTYHFFHSLGYFRRSDTITCESYLSRCKDRRKLTQIDREVLKYHYSYGICKGVKLDTFEEMHEKMQNTLLTDPNAKIYVVHSK